ncbi:Multicopper oxidase [Sporomusa acidovorans]|nr:multicopper oxidase mco [Sporomusa acidovorans DSM 3132]SDD67492.1 Multicopper oxidase [Sporomusa acidovorans]
MYPGDYVNIRVYNCLPESTSVHWHGLDVPNIMDGVPDVQASPAIKPGCYFDYHFRIINPPGTHMYHAHHNTAKQEMLGLAGGLIILDPNSDCLPVDRDYSLIIQEFAVIGLEHGMVKLGTYNINPLSDDLNFFTINGRSFPYTSPLEVNRGELIRVRLANPGDQVHPIHLHGHHFSIVASDGNSIHPCSRLRKNTIPVASGETFDLEFAADNPGVWPLHCHIPHHMSNNHMKQTGGMFTTVMYID